MADAARPAGAAARGWRGLTLHRSGLPSGDGTGTCGACAWMHRDAGEPRCRAAALGDDPGPEVVVNDAGCVLFEARVHCDPCGACCREAFDSVPVDDDDAARLAPHAELLRVADDGWRDLHRVPSPLGCGTRCVALRGDGGPHAPFRCVVYALRPTPCRDLDPGSAACLTARRRVGLSAWPPGVVADGPLARRD